jgi:hypothetical protein
MQDCRICKAYTYPPLVLTFKIHTVAMSSENYAGSMQKSDELVWMKMCTTVEKAKSTYHRKFERFKLSGDQVEDSSND